MQYTSEAPAGQWRSPKQGPRHSSWRFEDITFSDQKTGWLVNMSGEVFQSKDSGETWSLNTKLNGTLRSIEFISDKIGVIGSIDNSSLFRTTDGGQSWVEVDPSHHFFEGVCGLSHAGDHIFAVGRFSSDSTFYKSTDAGATWVKKDLSSLAISLVDVMFFNKNEGWITGHSSNLGEGAVLLKTQDGGNTWSYLYKSNNSLDHHVWKLEKITERFFVGSIWSNNHSSPAFMIRSIDGGKTFTRHQVSPHYFYVEGIGFWDEKLGWMGGGEGLWETRDGGLNWRPIPVGSNINRFFRHGNKLFAVGKEVHIYEK